MNSSPTPTNIHFLYDGNEPEAGRLLRFDPGQFPDSEHLGEGDALLKSLQAFLSLIGQGSEPLFLGNFPERLDEATDLRPIWATLAATGREVYIAVSNLRATREYREFGFRVVNCPVCGRETLDSHWLCPTCGWEYDGTTEETTHSSCNHSTPAQYRENRR